MKADPSQKNNLASTHESSTTAFQKEFDRWFAEVTKGLSLNERPIPAGFPGKSVELAAHEATFSGTLTYKEGHGWAHDWLVNWTSPNDRMEWQLQSKRPARYEVYLRYTCPEAQIGSTVEVTIGNSKLQTRITEAFDPPLLPSPDQVPRKEAYEKPWKLLKLGEMEVPAGSSVLSLHALKVAGKEVAEVKSVLLRPVGK